MKKSKFKQWGIRILGFATGVIILDFIVGALILLAFWWNHG